MDTIISSLTAVSALTLFAVVIAQPNADAKCSTDQSGNIIEPCRPPPSGTYENYDPTFARDESSPDYMLWIAAGFLASGGTAFVFMLRKYNK